MAGRAPSSRAVGAQTGAATVEKSLERPQIKNRATPWPGSPAPGYLYGENQNTKPNDAHPCVHRSAICSRRDAGATPVPVSSRPGEEEAVHVHDGMSLGH